jgi:hypothetical protein
VPPSLSRKPVPRPQQFGTIGVERITATLGIALIIAAAAANQSWLDRHFLPSFFIPRHWYVLIETIVRGAIVAVGASLLAGRSRVAALLTRAPTMTLRVVVAAVLAIASSEVALRWILRQPTEWLLRDEEPRRQVDAQLGWRLAPARVGRSIVAGRSLEYAVDAAGYRVRRVDEPVDPERPTIVFAGESVMFGEGLAWEESIPAQVSAMVGIQSANLAVHGYSTDQIYLRLARELPRFQQPVAVVSIFMTELFGRNLDDDRPYLGPGLVWHPAAHESRLMSLASLLVPYRRDTTVERGIRVTRELFFAMTEMARHRGAMPLVIVPEFGVADNVQRALQERILGPDIPTARVQLDPDWRLAWDRHPNALAARVIASAIAARLQPR